MQIKTEKISPELAEQYLSKNTANRTVARRRVSAYASDMKSGRWSFCPAPIVFSKAGDLIDGQHRLLAIIESGATPEMLVMRDAPSECRDTIDSGKTRSAADALAINGVMNSNGISAMSSRILAFERYGRNAATGEGHSWHNTVASASKSELVDYVLENIGYLENIYTRAVGIYSGAAIKILSPSEIGFLMHAMRPEEKANDFLTKVVLGVGVLDNSPELALRRILEKTRITKELHYSPAAFLLSRPRYQNGGNCDNAAADLKGESLDKGRCRLRDAYYCDGCYISAAQNYNQSPK